MAKISREDENEADKYGLMLMTRAGYDPDAMHTFMAHLGAVEKESHDALSKYLADHPGTAEAAGEPQRRPGAQPVAAHRRSAHRAGDPRLRHGALQHRRDEVLRHPQAPSRGRDRALRARPVAARARPGVEGRAEPRRRGRKSLAAGEGARRRAHQGAARRRAPAEPAASRPLAAARAAGDRAVERDASRRRRSRRGASKASIRSSAPRPHREHRVRHAGSLAACSRARTRASTRCCTT